MGNSPPPKVSPNHGTYLRVYSDRETSHHDGVLAALTLYYPFLPHHSIPLSVGDGFHQVGPGGTW